VEVRFDARTRRLRLIDGEVLVRVQHERRPFVVESDGVRVMALGTQYSVYNTGSSIRVTVFDGRVRLMGDRPGETTPPLKTPAAHRLDLVLEQGDQVEVGIADGRMTQRHRLSAEEMDRATSWMEGRLIFQGADLAEMVGEFNRYNSSQHLVITDPDLAGVRLGGIFQPTDVESFLNDLRVLGIEGVPEVGEPGDPLTIQLVRRREQPDGQSADPAPEGAHRAPGNP
jgi:transmembrane sensor